MQKHYEIVTIEDYEKFVGAKEVQIMCQRWSLESLSG
jgi:hypothetical protein